MVLSGEQRLALQHLCKDASRTPNVNLHVVLLPCEHNLWRSVVSRRDISGHLWVLDTCEAEIADLEIAVLVYEDVAGLEISVDNTCRVNIFQTTLDNPLALQRISDHSGYVYQDLVEKVLYELLLKRP
jgi:hypothetical protein